MLKTHLRAFGLILAVGMLTGFTGFSGLWAPDSFEKCRDKAAREAKTESGLRVLVSNCRRQFPKQSELQEDWIQFSMAIRKHRYDPSISIEERPDRSIPTERPVLSFKTVRNNSQKERELNKRLEELACLHGSRHMTTSGRAELLKTKEFINWFAGQTIKSQSLLVLPMLQQNEDQIFTLYENDRRGSC